MLKFWLTNILFLTGFILFFIFKTEHQLSCWWLLVWVHLFLLVQFIGSYFIGLNFHLRSMNALPGNQKQVMLTFDDGPDPEYTGKVLDVLKKHEVKAVFFVIGKNIAGQESLMERIVREGHLIGNHSYSHAFWFDLWPTSRVKTDLANCTQSIEIFQPFRKLFRPPYGVTNPNIARAVRTLGLRSIGWNIRSYDTSIKDVSKINQRILSRLKPGAIILLHDRLDFMPDLLEKLIPEIKARGYNFHLIS